MLVATKPKKITKRTVLTMTNNNTTTTNNQVTKNATLFQSMMIMTLPTIKAGNGKYSFGIVNSKNNGKRVTISKALAQALDLEDTAMFMPSREARKLVIGKALPFPHAITGKLRETNKMTCYLTSLVTLLTEMYDLDFSKHVSCTFSEIDLDTINGVTVAIVSFPAQASAGAVATANAIANASSEDSAEDDSLEEIA